MTAQVQTLERLIIRESLATELEQRRGLLLLVAWMAVLGIPLLTGIAYFLRPLEPYTVAGYVLLSVISLAFVLAVHFSPSRYFYRLANFWVGMLAIAILAQTLNLLFGSTESLYLNGRPPLLAACYVIFVVLCFTLLEQRTARALSWIFTMALMAILGIHTALRLDAFESYYALGMMATAIGLMMPASIAMLRLHFLVHVHAVDRARDRMDEERLMRRERERDPVTGALSRGGLIAALTSALHRNSNFGLLALKVNDQEKVQESLGSNDFDRLLQAIVDTLRAQLGSRLDIGRREGSEILLWSEQFASSGQLREAGLSLLNTLEAADLPGRDRVAISFRAAGTVSDPHFDAAFLVEDVLFRLFLAKSRKQRVCVES